MKSLKLYFFAASLLLLSTITNAQTDYFWVGSTGNELWSDPNNWSLSSGSLIAAPNHPQLDDNVIFDGGSVSNCILDIDDLDGDADPSTNTFSNFTFDPAFSLAVTFGGNYNINMASLTVEGGSFDWTGGGTLTVSGSVLINGGILDMGDAQGVHSFGSLTNSSGIFDGGDVQQILVNGAVTINGGTFTSTSGELTIENSGTSIISFTSGSFNSNSGLVSVTLISNSTNTISSGLAFNNLTITNPSSSVSRTLSFGSGTTTVSGILALTATGIRTVNLTGGGTINVSGDVDMSNHNGSGSPSHNCTIVFNGTSGTSNLIGSSAIGTGRLPHININQSGSGSLVVSDFINLAGNWTYTSNTSVTANTSTLTIYGTRNLDATNTSLVTMAFNDVNIGRTGATANVTLTGAIQINGNLTINSSSTLNTGASNFGLTLGGSISNLGTFTPNNSVITLTGSSAQSLDFRNATTPTIHSLVSSKSSGTATITDAINISTLLQCTGGTLALGSNLVTLLSNSTTTAQVGNSTGGTYTGEANIQRFIPSVGRRWRFLAAPVTSGATVANSWRNGMFITGPGTGTGPVGLANYNSNGFDWTLANSPTIYTYNENQAIDFNSRWVALPSATTALNRGTGYRVFVRGDRSDVGRLNGTVTTQNEVTLTANGGIPHGSLNVPVTCSNGCTTDDGWNLIGNPYPATLDWDDVQSTNSANISAAYHVYNPNTNAYDAYSGGIGDATRYIASGQAFWIKKTSVGSANISFLESHKQTEQAGGAKFKSNTLTNTLKITLGGNGFSNNAYVHQTANALYGTDNFDAVKFGYGNYQIATFEPSNATRLAINKLPLYGTKTTDTVEVEVNVPAAAANYQLSFADVNTFNSNLKVYLQDKMLNTLQDLSTANTYSFATNGTAGSTGNRFRVLITNQTNPLPVVFTALEAKLNNSATDLKWSTLSEKNNAKFIVERSTDMVNFIEIGLVKAVGNSNIKNTYTFTDVKPEAYTTNYYRIKQVDFDGKFAYSNIASITTDTKGNGLNNADEVTTTAKVFPVPTKDVLNIEQLDGTTLTYSIVDVFGSEVLNGTTEITENGSSINVSTLANGIYFLVAKTDNGMATKTRFIVE